MDFQSAVRKSIRQYFEGKEPEGYRKVSTTRGKNKRNKKYFDQIEVDLGLKESEDKEDMKGEVDERDA